MVTEAWKKAGELRWRALESGTKADFDAALAAQCTAEREDMAKDADTSRQLPERLARVGREIDEVAREVVEIEGARSELQMSPAKTYYPKLVPSRREEKPTAYVDLARFIIEGNPAAGMLPATESPKTTRRRTKMVKKANQEGAAPAAEGTESKPRKARATGGELAHKRLDGVVKALQKMGETPTKGFVPEDKFKAGFAQIRELVAEAEAKMAAERSAKGETKADQLKLAY